MVYICVQLLILSIYVYYIPLTKARPGWNRGADGESTRTRSSCWGQYTSMVELMISREHNNSIMTTRMHLYSTALLDVNYHDLDL